MKLVPHKMCSTCVRELLKWSRGAKNTFISKTLMVWMEPVNHIDVDCYFYCTNTKGFNCKNKADIAYPSVNSMIFTYTSRSR